MGKRDGKLSYHRVTRKQSVLVHEEWDEKMPEEVAEPAEFHYDPNIDFSVLTAPPKSDKVNP